MQDLVVWNTQLNDSDARILYNSGSWFDIHGHASASHIWDWWALGEESNVGQSVGSALSTGTPVTSIAPTIGRHNISPLDNSKIFVAQGIQTNTNNTDWWNNVQDKLTSNSYEVDRSSGAFSVHKLAGSGSFESSIYSKTGNTFTAPSFGSTFTYVSGAYHGDYIEIEGKRFIIDATGSTSGLSFAESSGHIYVNSKNDSYYDNLMQAINTHTTNFTASYATYGGIGNFFVRKDTHGPSGATTYLESGNTFSSLLHITGANPVASTLEDQETLTIGTDVLTIGHTTSGSGNFYVNTAHTHRKALRWPATSTKKLTLIKHLILI